MFESKVLYTISVPDPTQHKKDLREQVTITLNIQEAVIYRNTELFTKMDPFMQIEFDGKHYKTKALKDAGKNPVWNESFSFPVYSMDDRFVLRCFDQDLVTNDKVGTAVFTVE